jgi:hypothetical protein
MSAIGNMLGLKKHNLRMAGSFIRNNASTVNALATDEDTLRVTLGVSRGSLSALSIINDKKVMFCLRLHPFTAVYTLVQDCIGKLDKHNLNTAEKCNIGDGRGAVQ